VYRDPRWFECRRQAVRAAGHRCQVVENGVRCPVMDVAGGRLHGHHSYPGGVRQMLRDGVSPFDPRRVKVCCAAHHSRIEQQLRAEAKTARGRLRR